jgi:hypothetical protein
VGLPAFQSAMERVISDELETIQKFGERLSLGEFRVW